MGSCADVQPGGQAPFGDTLAGAEQAGRGALIWRRIAAPISAPNLGHDLPGEAAGGVERRSRRHAICPGPSGAGTLSAGYGRQPRAAWKPSMSCRAGWSVRSHRLADTADVLLT